MTQGEAVSRDTDEPRQKHVLVVDDEAATRALIKATVEGSSVRCRISEAADGDTALKIARESRPDLVLLDIVLPGSSASGVLVCEELCKDPRTKVIIVSGQAGAGIIDACLSAGALQHVSKPFSVPDMRAKLEQWLSS